MSGRVIAIACGLLLVVSGCALKTPGVEPECLPGVKTPLLDIPGIEQLGTVVIKDKTTNLSTSGGIQVHSIGSKVNNWVVRLPQNESVMLFVEPGHGMSKTGFPYSILSNDGEKNLYLQKQQCTSLIPRGDAFAYIGDVTLTVYVKQM